MEHRNPQKTTLSRRALLHGLGATALTLRTAPLWAGALPRSSHNDRNAAAAALSFDKDRYKPRYPNQASFLEILQFVPPGSDSYFTEKYASEIEDLFARWGRELRHSPLSHSEISAALPDPFEASSLTPVHEAVTRDRAGIRITQRSFADATSTSVAAFTEQLRQWLSPLAIITVTEFEIYAIEVLAASPLRVSVTMRYDITGARHDRGRQESVGNWQLVCSQSPSGHWTIQRWQATNEQLSIGQSSPFVDITSHALASNTSFPQQLQHGVDHWRTVLDGASGIDIYANNGVATGDYDNDGFDDIYVCQPAGLPNRLYRNRGDGTFEDVSTHAGVDVLDNTACALFADFDNRGLQDLLIVCGAGPLLFRNQGNGTFSLKHDAFQFTTPPNGTFTHAALADYDNDGHLDIYFCTYQYYLGLDQYHYPAPYYDARNGPQNCLLHNDGEGHFAEVTQAAGLNVENNRYSFACAWGDSNGNGRPDLCIANDFGKSQLYRNNGDGTFHVASSESHIEDVGAGMGVCWADFNNDGHQDIYVASMWEAAGQRVSTQQQFHPDAPPEIRQLYQRHARGNALYRNNHDGTFSNVGQQTGAAMGRWSWAADAWDFDHDGFSDLYVTNGYISAPDSTDIASFFWRQIVANSPEDASPRLAYEHGWNAINELVRADSSWNAYERNVMFANNGDGTFAEVSSIVGLDCLEDSRSFALADIDHDGRQELILKNRNAPQLRILRNNLTSIGNSVFFRLRGHKSNRDAIGAAITLHAGSLQQTKYLQAGTGFLGQHSKELFFGVGDTQASMKASIRWPSGLTQNFDGLPVNHRIELEEGSPTFTAKPFAEPTPLPPQQVEATPLEPLPTQIQTWLTTPLKAPGFTLPDTSGSQHRLEDYRGHDVLLTLWSTSSTASTAHLAQLQKSSAQRPHPSLQILALNLDDPALAASVRSVSSRQGLSFPVLLGTPEIGGVYNIVYRYLFDRRRDIAFPTSFLLNKDGDIIRIYQGPVSLESVLHDLDTAPRTPQQRIERALPFKGSFYLSSLQRNDFTYGVALFQHGYFTQAEESFQQVVAQHPNDPEAFYNLGTLNLRRNNFSKASEYLQQAIKLRPNYPEAWNNLGMIAAQQGHAEDAVQHFQQALQLRPNYETALLNLGNVYRHAGAFPQASEALQQALALQPDDPEVQFSLGMVYAHQDQFQTAADFLSRAIALRPAYPEALNNLGIIYVRLQQTDKAELQFKTAIERSPDNDQAYLNLARLYAMQGDKPLARAALQQLLQRQPQNPAALQAMEVLQ